MRGLFTRVLAGVWYLALVTSGCGSAKGNRTSDASGDTAHLGDGQPHGCHSDDDCGPMAQSCTPTHTCCAGYGSDCAFRIAGPADAVTLAPCHSDDACASNEYCQNDISQCCLVGYICDQTTAMDAGGVEAPTEDVGLPSEDAPHLPDAAEDGHIICGANYYCNLAGNCCGIGAVCSITPSDAGTCFPPI
jgi:hypothetical protein